MDEEEFISPDFRNRRGAVYDKKADEAATLKKPKKQKSNISNFFKKLLPNIPSKKS